MYEAAELDRVFVQARRVTLRLVAEPREKTPDVEVSYTLEDGWPYVLVTTTFSNRGTTALDVDLVNAIRADHSFESSPEAPTDLFWAYDKHFGQAYGVVAEGHDILGANARRLMLRYRDRNGKVAVRLAPGETHRLTRRVIPGANLFEVRRTSPIGVAGKADRPVRLAVKDTAGRPVREADVVLASDGKPMGLGAHRRRREPAARRGPKRRRARRSRRSATGRRRSRSAPRSPRRSRSSCPRPPWS